MKTNYRPDRPAGLEGRLNKGDFEYISIVEQSLKHYGDEFNGAQERVASRDRIIHGQKQELVLHRKYLAVLAKLGEYKAGYLR